jgi:protein O-GlcNAc transferase
VSIPQSLAQRLLVARNVIVSRLAQPLRRPYHPVLRLRSRLHVIYVSADFRTHKAGLLRQTLFIDFEKTGVQVSCVSTLQPPPLSDPLRRRIVRAVDAFIDVGSLPPLQLAQLINRLSAHVVVDLNSHNKGGLEASVQLTRPAPVWLVYPDYPGTSGAHDSVLACDRVVVPPEFARKAYAESLLLLPGSFFLNDHRQSLPDVRPHVLVQPSASCFGSSNGSGPRAAGTEAMLKARGLVAASFNQPYKLSRRMLDAWLDLFGANCTGCNTKCSQLWLGVSDKRTRKNLEAYVLRRSGSARHSVFFFDVGGLPRARHFERLACADLALDPPLLNGITVSADTIWAGVPLLAMAGQHFGERVSASLLMASASATAAAMLARNLRDYYQLARSLLNNATRLHEMRAQLAADVRSSSNLLFAHDQWRCAWYAALRLLVESAICGCATYHIVKSTEGFCSAPSGSSSGSAY